MSREGDKALGAPDLAPRSSTFAASNDLIASPENRIHRTSFVPENSRREEIEETVHSSSSSTTASLSIDLEKQTPAHTARNEEKSIVTAPLARAKTQEGARSLHAKSLRSIHSHRSYAANDGYTYFSDDSTPHRNASTHGATTAPHEDDDAEHDTPNPFLVTWGELGDRDPLNPRSMSKLRRWIVVLILSASSLCVTCTSSLYTSTYSQLGPEFGSSRLVCTLGLSLFVAGLGTGPMILAPLSEFFGRRPIYICSFSFFLIWMIPCAVAQNMQTMLVARFLDGFVGSAFLSVAGGTVGDMFARHELSAPMMVYTASPFVGPEVGPLVGGFIVENTTWRWCFYVLIIWSGVQLLLIILLVPETYHPVLLRNKARKLRSETGDERWIAPIEQLTRSIPKTLLWSCIRPFQLLVCEPMCLSLCIHSAILLGILYLFFGAFPLVFQNNHNFSISQTGLSFLGLFVGMLAGVSSDPLWRRQYEKLVRERERKGGEPGGSEPEYRLPSTVVGSWIVPIALFGFGWTTYSHCHLLLFRHFYLSGRVACVRIVRGRRLLTRGLDPVYAASALAANSFARSYFAGAFPLFGVQMFENLGYQWATTVLAFLALAMAPFPPLFFKYGKRLRGRSRFASA
ncbi:major facilitator superfamily domain-containing protein [Dendryphion nanum]|uniref:Major facilitator superfamily domain-containing protein n=1 Tax=Dendryphion nanum TaxID=256645 RepID=A0A9P9DIT8_9PLEO|nr:major facilitator superfamily domain-containing protein [Dendryphion nanum]